MQCINEIYFKGLSDPDVPFDVADDGITQCNEQYERGEFQILFEELNVPIEMGRITYSFEAIAKWR